VYREEKEREMAFKFTVSANCAIAGAASARIAAKENILDDFFCV
jgi:hypothetical protein